jgi:hypothetical protein
MCNVLKWRISKLESKIYSLESEKFRLKRRLVVAQRERKKWRDSYTTQTPTKLSTKS